MKQKGEWQADQEKWANNFVDDEVKQEVCDVAVRFKINLKGL